MFLSLVFHNHQPVGQLPWVLEAAWRDSYDPFLDVLEKHPAVRAALHFSGPLLEWLCEHRPATVQRVRAMAQRGQVELLAGGYYEPISAIWPRDDQIAQITRLRDRVRELFSVESRGLWLAERVWEPSLASVLMECGIEYTFVDGSVFASAGLSENQTFGAWNLAAEALESGRETRAGAAALAVLPINGPLRQLIPFGPVEESLRYLRGVHDDVSSDALVVFADDGEKFGAWPGTHDHVFTHGWLDRFFAALEANADWFSTVTPGDYLALHSARDVAALPAGSYPEMQQWSGGGWRNFLERYAESRDIHNEVLRVRQQVLNTPPGATRDAAYEHVLRAQCNDALWHGVFGGLYGRHLRQALYAEAAQAQVLCEGARPFVRVESVASRAEKARDEPSRDAQTHSAPAEVFLQNEWQKIGIRARGGHIFGWTSKAARHNLLSTLRRYRESYHDADATVDWYPRGALLDHFFGDGATPENFATARYPEEGDFASELWTLETQSDGDAASLLARRDGHVWQGGEHLPLSVEKRLQMRAGSSELRVAYRFLNRSAHPLDLWWANEWNIAVTGTELPDRHYHADDYKHRLRLDETAQFDTVTNPIVADRWLQLWFEWFFDEPFAMWHVPLFTQSQTEGGALERSHQSSAFVFHRRLHLPPRSEHALAFTALITAKRPLLDNDGE